jgi:hypothetical protein
MRIKYERVHVPYFCENCKRVAFEGKVFGREVERHVYAQSGDRAMYCDHCKPKPLTFKCQLSSFFSPTTETPSDG